MLENPRSSSVVGGYYTNDDAALQEEIYSFFGFFEKEFWVDSIKVREYYKEAKKVKEVYGEKYFNRMETLNQYCEAFYEKDIQIPNMFFGGSTERYLKFKNDNKICKNFREILYEGLADIVIEKTNDKFMVYPRFKFDFYKKFNTDLEKVDDLFFRIEKSVFEYLKDDKDYTFEELAEKLTNMSIDNNDNEKTNKIRLFGIKYANSLTDNAYSLTKLVAAAGLENSYYSEIRKGINLSKHVILIEDLYETEKEDLYETEKKEEEFHQKYIYQNYKDPGQNLIVYGTPGCGKSFYVENTLLKEIPFKIRVTFYQDFTNTDFVGQILPVIKKDNSVETVTYIFNPGPFTLALEYAISNPDKPVALVIEELNRGNAPSIFGDIFQLLDRDATGKSVFPITNINIQNYLREKNKKYIFNEIFIPSNMNIFATMNTSDQNVYTLDTAFKRRWEFVKLKNDFNRDHPFKKWGIPGMKEKTWEDFVNSINKYILKKDNLFMSEDKQIGVYFIDKNTLIPEEITFDYSKDSKKVQKFAYKMFEYLWNDVAKYKEDKAKWFIECQSLDELIEKYEKESKTLDGAKVFATDIFE